MDKNTKIVNFTTGLTLGEIYSQLWMTNNLSIAGGTCPGVGIGMHILVSIKLHIDRLARPTVTASSDHCFRTCLSVRTSKI